MKSIRTCISLLSLLIGCAPAPPAQPPTDPAASPGAPSTVASEALANSSADASLTSGSVLTSNEPPPVTSTDQPRAANSNSPAPPTSTAFNGSHTDSEQPPPDTLVLPPDASGPAVGGPRGGRPCTFHESVDTYNRVCTARQNPDGSLQVEAKGTRLNPDNGFEFTMHGGPHNFFAHGTLNAFGVCAGPFTAYVHTVVDKGVTTYELRFKEHCKIVIR